MGDEVIELAGFDSIVSAAASERSWVPAAFPLPDGSLWTYQEPDAVVVVQDGRLRVSAAPYTRGHDEVQILDNAKHMYFSTRSFEAPPDGRLTAAWEMSAQVVDGRPGDLYDGFVSFHLMDLARGVAANVFLGNRELATVYARLPFPGSKGATTGAGPRYFALFDEFRGRTGPGETHAFAITYDRGAGTLEHRMDGAVLRREVDVPEMGPFLVALGLMTEKDIQPGKGSVSCHGQGAIGTWGRIALTLEAP